MFTCNVSLPGNLLGSSICFLKETLTLKANFEKYRGSSDDTYCCFEDIFRISQRLFQLKQAVFGLLRNKEDVCKVAAVSIKPEMTAGSDVFCLLKVKHKGC